MGPRVVVVFEDLTSIVLLGNVHVGYSTPMQDLLVEEILALA